jgi:hypothetical protein
MKKLFFLSLFFLLKPVFASLNDGDLMTIANDNRFQSRCSYTLDVAAVNVIAESTTTANHIQRTSYAKNVVAGNFTPKTIAIGVLTNSTIAAEAALGSADFSIPDSDIQFTVNTLFNDFAGIGQ